MADVSVEVSGEMEVPEGIDPKGLSRFFQVPTQLPDPKTFVLQRWQNVRPWLQFVQTSNFKPPVSVPRLSRRIVKNLSYFQSNYLFVSIGLIIYCLITSPLLLVAMCLSFYASYRLTKRSAEKKLSIIGHELTITQQYALVAVCSMPFYYWAGAGAAMFWVLGASVFIITLHAAFYNIDALLPEDGAEFGLLQEV